MYTKEIIEMLTWPVLLIISYQVIKFLLLKYNHKLEAPEKEDE